MSALVRPGVNDTAASSSLCSWSLIAYAGACCLELCRISSHAGDLQPARKQAGAPLPLSPEYLCRGVERVLRPRIVLAAHALPASAPSRRVLHVSTMMTQPMRNDDAFFWRSLPCANC